MTVARVVAEIVALLVFVVAIQWLASFLLQTDGFWPLVMYSAIYLGVRAFLFARRQRAVR